MSMIEKNQRKTICVFCASRDGADPKYAKMAETIGALLGQRGYDVVYGGSDKGLMGRVARSAMAHGATVHAVRPEFMKKFEGFLLEGTVFHPVSDMFQRKLRMMELSDAFITIPGGIGTLDELSEMWTWQALGQINKPSAMWNFDGFYDPLLKTFEFWVKEGMMSEDVYRELIVRNDINALLAALEERMAENKEQCA